MSERPTTVLLLKVSHPKRLSSDRIAVLLNRVISDGYEESQDEHNLQGETRDEDCVDLSHVSIDDCSVHDSEIRLLHIVEKNDGGVFDPAIVTFDEAKATRVYNDIVKDNGRQLDEVDLAEYDENDLTNVVQIDGVSYDISDEYGDVVAKQFVSEVV